MALTGLSQTLHQEYLQWTDTMSVDLFWRIYHKIAVEKWSYLRRKARMSKLQDYEIKPVVSALKRKCKDCKINSFIYCEFGLYTEEPYFKTINFMVVNIYEHAR